MNPNRRRRTPLSHRLAILIGAVALPLICLALVTIWFQYRQERARAEHQLVEHAQTIAQLVDREFTHAETVAQVLAASPSLKRGDLDEFDAELRSARDLLTPGLISGLASASVIAPAPRLAPDPAPGSAPRLTPDLPQPVLVLLDAHGKRLLNTTWPSGYRPSGVPGLPEAQAAIAEGRSRVPNLYINPVSGVPRISVVSVMFSPPDADGRTRTLGAIGIAIPRERFVEIVDRASAAIGFTVAIYDRAGSRVARSLNDAETMGKQPRLGVLDALASGDAGLGPRGLLTLEGVPSTFGFAHAAHGGYSVTVTAAEKTFLAPLRASLIRSLVVGAVVLAGGLVLATILARRIVSSFASAIGLASGAQNGRLLRSTGMREADAFAGILAATFAERERAARDANALFDISPIGVVIADAGGQMLQANDACLAIIGRTRTMLAAGGIHWDEITPPEWLADLQAAVASALASGRSAPFEREFLRPDGSRVPVLMSIGTTDTDAGIVAAFIVDLTDLRAAETGRRRSDAFARSILEATTDCVVVLDGEGRLAFMNEAGCRQTEIQDIGEVIGRPATELWPEAAAPTVREALDATRAGHPKSFTVFGPAGDGTPKWWDVSVSALPDPDGKPYRQLLVARDITEARQAADTLARYADRQELLLRVMDAMLANRGDQGALAGVVFDAVAVNLQVDICFSHHFDAASGTLLLVAAPGLPPGLIDLASNVPVGQAFAGTVAATGKPLVADARRIARDPRASVARQMGVQAFACYPVLGTQGELLGTFSFASLRRDRFDTEEIEFLQTLSNIISISWQRYFAETAQRESDARFHTITDAMPQIVWSTQPDGFHDYYNQRWYDLTGTTPEETLGGGWNPVFHPDDQDRAWERWNHSLATGEPYEIEYRLRMADGGYRWMLGRALPSRDPKTGAITRWFGTCTDIEETVAARKVLEQSGEELEAVITERTRDLQATQERLAQSQRMEALGHLAGGIAHDFNNVLQVIEGSSALIERRPTDADDVRRLARMVLNAAERGTAITRRLLYFSRRGDLRAEPVDPLAMHTNIREILSHTLGDGIEVRLDVPAGLRPMMADKGQLETVLINLATNARDAMAGMGVLTLAAASEVLRPGQVARYPAGLRPGAYTSLSVSDTGVGMDAATVDRASDPFFTTKPVGHGTGLGLAMARGFAEQSGGALHIASVLGWGTTVTLWFPVAEANAVTVDAAADVAPDTPSAKPGHHLLLVDDDRSVREVMAEQMQAAGFAVTAVASAAAALALLDDGHRVDALVSDLSMPEMDGMALIEEAQRRRPALPAILLTGFATNAAEIAVGGALSGTFSLLHKPVSGKQLQERLSVLLGQAATLDHAPQG